MALVVAKIPKVQPAEPSIRVTAFEDLHRCDRIGFVPAELTRTSEAK